MQTFWYGNATGTARNAHRRDPGTLAPNWPGPRDPIAKLARTPGPQHQIGPDPRTLGGQGPVGGDSALALRGACQRRARTRPCTLSNLAHIRSFRTVDHAVDRTVLTCAAALELARIMPPKRKTPAKKTPAKKKSPAKKRAAPRSPSPAGAEGEEAGYLFKSQVGARGQCRSSLGSHNSCQSPPSIACVRDSGAGTTDSRCVDSFCLRLLVHRG